MFQAYTANERRTNKKYFNFGTNPCFLSELFYGNENYALRLVKQLSNLTFPFVSERLVKAYFIHILIRKK